jgi:hypothetical protein
MAQITTEASIDQEISKQMESLLKQVDGVVSLHSLFRDGIFSTWVGTTKYSDKEARHSVYSIEDKIEKEFPRIKFDFHLIAVPPGRKIDDFISNATLVFKRTE